MFLSGSLRLRRGLTSPTTGKSSPQRKALKAPQLRLLPIRAPTMPEASETAAHAIINEPNIPIVYQCLKRLYAPLLLFFL